MTLRRPSWRARFFSARKLMARYMSGVMPELAAALTPSASWASSSARDVSNLVGALLP